MKNLQRVTVLTEIVPFRLFHFPVSPLNSLIFCFLNVFILSVLRLYKLSKLPYTTINFTVISYWIMRIHSDFFTNTTYLLFTWHFSYRTPILSKKKFFTINFISPLSSYAQITNVLFFFKTMQNDHFLSGKTEIVPFRLFHFFVSPLNSLIFCFLNVLILSVSRLHKLSKLPYTTINCTDCVKLCTNKNHS
jgi:hypothetical protein